jgi:hypothetical protein
MRTDAATRPRGARNLLSLALLPALIAGAGQVAAAELALSEDLVGLPGQTVTALLTITDVGPISVESLDIQFTYDPAVLTFLTGRNGTGLDGGAFSPTDPIINDLGGMVIIAGTTLLVGVTPPEGGVLFELDFQIRGDAVVGTTTMQQLAEVRINESDVYTSLPPTPNALPGRVVVAASAPPQAFDMTVGKLDATGTDLEIAWADVGCTGDLDHQIVYGFGSQFPASLGDSYPLSGSQCSIGVAPVYSWLASPDPAGDASGLLWWLVLATDGVVAEGAWGPDSAGGERKGPGPAGSSGECGIAAKDLSNSCMP